MRLQRVVLLVTMLACGWLCELHAQSPARQFRNRLFQPGRFRQYQQNTLPQESPGSPSRSSSRREQQAEHLYRTGRSYIEQGFYSEGLDALNQSLALRPGHPRSLMYKGIALRALREPRLALQFLNEAIAAAPDDGAAYGERALTHIVLGDREKADEDLKLAARLRPDLTPWFRQQSQWMESVGRRVLNEPGSPLDSPLGQDPAGEGDEASSADGTASEGEQESSESSSSRPWAEWLDARSLIKPALSFAAGILAVILVLRLVFAIGRRILRLVFRLRSGNYSSRQTALFTGRRTPAEAPLSGDTASHTSTAMSLSRPSFLQRHGRFLAIVAAGLGIAVACGIPVVVQAFRLDVDKLIAPRERPTVLDYRGNVYTQLGTPDNPIEFSDLPQHLVDALRAREDSRFFEHHGVDWIGLARALITDLLHLRIKQGASTITMQLVEKVYQLNQKGLVNRVRSKLVEWTMAHRGEAALTRKLGDRRAAKEAIMTAYLNRVEFGDGVVGVGAASEYYFEKPVSKLSLGESCMLVALLRAPYANSPYRKPENSRLARDKIVAQMVRRGFITEDEGKRARFLVVDNPRKPRARHNGYLVAAITREINRLKDEGKLPADAWNDNSLTIQSTLDLWAQDILDSEVRKVCASFSGDTSDDPLLGTAMMIDNATGQVRALVSGQDYAKNQYDLAFSSRRQVASIAKPFVYGAYLERGGNMTEVASNAPLDADEIRALNKWNPGNSSSLKEGTHPLSTGLAFSDNLITVRVGLGAGLQHVYQTLYKAGLISDKQTTGPTWLLGTFDCSLANVVSAYSAFPRGGSRVTPYLVQSVSLGGVEVYHAEPRIVGLFSRQTCEQLHAALREAMTEGTGRSAMRKADLDAQVAGKTGTSQNSADVWWVGYVDELTLGIRFGRNSNKSVGGAAAGGTMSAPVAARVLKKLSERYPIEEKNTSLQ